MKTKLKRDNSANNQSLRSNRTNWITQTTLIWSKLFSKKKQHVRITVHSSSHMQNEINKSTFRSKTIHLHSSVKPQAGYSFFFTFHNSASTTSFNLLNAFMLIFVRNALEKLVFSHVPMAIQIEAWMAPIFVQFNLKCVAN